MKSAAFEYDLPPGMIAQSPAEPRDASRLLVDGDPVVHRLTRDLPELIEPGDVVVVNDTKVLPARLRLFKPTGGAVEVLALEPATDGWWEALVRPSRRVPIGSRLAGADGRELIEVGAATGSGTRLIRALAQPMVEILHTAGAVPLPPYITTALDDPDRYQTVFARHETSVAAPTAGLHLTPDVLDRCRKAGASIHSVELSVGVGTFRPLETDMVADHVMHSERYVVPAQTWDECQRARRVVAVGTTVVRTLEAVAASGSLEGRTDLFIQPGFDFRVVDSLLTNFHMPRSTLLVMIEAFVGERWRSLYEAALAEDYRFLSFGDAMFVQRDRPYSGVSGR